SKSPRRSLRYGGGRAPAPDATGASQADGIFPPQRMRPGDTTLTSPVSSPLVTKLTGDTMGRPPIGEEAMSGAEPTRKYRASVRHDRPLTKQAGADVEPLKARIPALQGQLSPAP